MASKISTHQYQAMPNRLAGFLSSTLASCFSSDELLWSLDVCSPSTCPSSALSDGSVVAAPSTCGVVLVAAVCGVGVVVAPRPLGALLERLLAEFPDGPTGVTTTG